MEIEGASTRHRGRNRRAIAGTLAALGLLATGCGGGGDDESSTTTAPTEESTPDTTGTTGTTTGEPDAAGRTLDVVPVHQGGFTYQLEEFEAFAEDAVVVVVGTVTNDGAEDGDPTDTVVLEVDGEEFPTAFDSEIPFGLRSGESLPFTYRFAVTDVQAAGEGTIVIGPEEESPARVPLAGDDDVVANEAVPLEVSGSFDADLSTFTITGGERRFDDLELHVGVPTGTVHLYVTFSVTNNSTEPAGLVYTPDDDLSLVGPDGEEIATETLFQNSQVIAPGETVDDQVVRFEIPADAEGGFTIRGFRPSDVTSPGGTGGLDFELPPL